MYYYYDENGSPIAVSYDNSWPYYYYKNIFGDILGIMDSCGNVVVRYYYDAWGNIISTTGSMASTLGRDNPFRYRGYYYDTETGFYYLNARYYNPEWGRFISADPVLNTNNAIGCNLFAYCKNNPVLYVDIYGEAPQENNIDANIYKTSLDYLQKGISHKLSENTIILPGYQTPEQVSGTELAGRTGTYSELRKLAAGNPNYEVHHLIEVRAIVQGAFDISPNSGPAVILEKEYHHRVTGKLRQPPYGYGKTYTTAEYSKNYKNVYSELGHEDWLLLIADFLE